MEQPPEFHQSSGKCSLVYELNKAIYGLKQEPRVWFERLHHFLLLWAFIFQGR